VSEDLSTADVYVSIMGTPGEQTAGLNALRHAAGMMRGRLTREMNLRQAPYIKFHIDEQLKKEMALMDLLHKVRQEQEEKEAAQKAASGDAPQERQEQQQQQQHGGAQGDAETKDESRD
jgi:hypothetical protein